MGGSIKHESLKYSQHLAEKEGRSVHTPGTNYRKTKTKAEGLNSKGGSGSHYFDDGGDNSGKS